MSDLKEAFALALRELRMHADLAQNDFPPEVSREYVSLLERGLRSPTLETIDSLAKVMSIAPLTLVILCYLRREPSRSLDELLGEVRMQLQRDLIEQSETVTKDE
ncbi:helix-turn-helix domain-containing protein [Pseudomonas sp. NY15374]|uniref:helix-turn-helix domain-containing protein n=1 Tax=Pseudomonas sp. NY15374 TaxID=3400357 RepID=UPI003A8A8062